MTIARLAPARPARSGSHARPRPPGRLLALSADACACVILTGVIPLALIYGTAGQLRPPGPGLPAMAALVPAAAVMIGRTGRDWEVLVAGLAAMGLAGELGDVARTFALTGLAALVRGAGAGLALAGAVAFARARQHARARAAGPGGVPLRWWWAAVTVSAVVCAPVLGAGAGGAAGAAGWERRDMLTDGVLAVETVVVIALAAMAARGRARRARPAFLVLAVTAGCALTAAGSLMLDRRTLALAASAAIAAAAFAARRPVPGIGAILLTGGVLAYLLAASPPALAAGLPCALLAAALAAALSAALGRGAFGGACPLAPYPGVTYGARGASGASGAWALYLKTYTARGPSAGNPGASGASAAWPGGHHLVAGAMVLVSGILVGYLTVGALQENGYGGAAGNIYVVHR